MKKPDLEHLLRAAGRILDEKQFIVIGSQSLLGKYPNAPPALTMSMEADFITRNKKKNGELLNNIGENSLFHDQFGYYVDPVDERTARLPKGWKGRLINLNTPATEGVTGLCLHPHDLFVAKIAAGREKDFDFARAMIEHDMVTKDSVLELAATVPNPEDDLGLSRRITARTKRLFTAAQRSD